uniref:NADH-ubiquinone oxidoreductase chain 2 n=1 Tax=Leptynoptera sulfurea TaxID=1950150 RepID=A0A344A2H4_9HEMI|nr:NADH dehydrogenase subunit 2 [Leptynoptera sulfurea]AWU48965.1 NADH dehydrogenase subunit 2 [Leptynoptera sulfurea]
MNIWMWPMYVTSILISLSNESWMMIWIGMELNLLMFIFISLNPNNLLNNESSMKYFLVQSIGSLFFLLTINMNMIFYSENSLNLLFPSFALMLKSGVAPFHSWTPVLMNKFSFLGLFLFFTLQKLVPMYLLYSTWLWTIPLIALINIMIGSMEGINQSSFFKMMIFSSISNNGWMLMMLLESMFLFWMFFINYFLLNFLIYIFFVKNEVKWILQIKSNKSYMKWHYMFMFLSMSSFPPFLGFTPKWMMMKTLCTTMPFLMIISVIMSIYMMFFYMKSMLSLILDSSSQKKWILNKQTKINMYVFINFLGPILFFLLN